MRCSLLLVAVSACGPRQAPTPPVVLRPVAASELRALADFQSIADRSAVSGPGVLVDIDSSEDLARRNYFDID